MELLCAPRYAECPSPFFRYMALMMCRHDSGVCPRQSYLNNPFSAPAKAQGRNDEGVTVWQLRDPDITGKKVNKSAGIRYNSRSL